ncbi:MAG: tetraacyldisaccharide 4'-kinase [bacterium]|nr:tetraacyldisaccharide 4'-kinase [bacterium]
MNTVDLRPAAIRRLTAAWQGGERRPPSLLADTWTRLADAWQARRAAGRPAPAGAALVVSIGNLALGGTGKTPVTAQLARDLAAGGLRGAVLTRGYGSRLEGPCRVCADTPGAGDEARLLAGMLASAGWTVVQARRRARGISWLAAHEPGLDVLLVEDGHQTAGVGRHLDILIVAAAADTSGPTLRPLAGRVAPFGPWRESAVGAARAAVWLVEAGETLPAGPAGTTVAAFRREYRFEGGAPAGRSVALLSGIARPEVFEAAAAQLLVAEPALVIRCRDHEPYGDRLLARIDGLLRSAAIDAVVTTAKDRVKLAARWDGRPGLRVLEMQVRWTGALALPDLVRERLDAVRRGGAAD